MDTQDSRFDITGTEYNLWVGVDPVYQELQQLVAKKTHALMQPWLKAYWPLHACVPWGYNLDGVVWELGVGSGVTAKMILQEDMKVPHFVGIDINERFLRGAARRLRRFPGTELRKGDLLKTLRNPKDREHPRLVVSAFTIHNLPREYRTKLFPAIFTRLQSGGYFLTGDKVAVDDTAQHDTNYAKWVALMGKLREQGHEKLYQYAVGHEQEDYDNRLTESELREHLENAGFVDIHIERLPDEHQMHVLAWGRKP